MTYLFKLLFKNSYQFIKNPYYREFHKLALNYGSIKRFTSKTIKFAGFRFLVPDCISFIWQFKEIFVDEYYYFQSNNAAPIIFDCGANIGTSCAYFKKLFPKAIVYAFEADPEIAKTFTNNIKTNSLSDVKIFPQAVWIHDGHIQITQEGADGASVYSEGNKIKVPCIRLKNFLQKEEEIDMLKMDIEGAETDVLKDCREELTKVNNIFIEFHSFINRPQDLDVILQILTESGLRYKIYSENNKPRPIQQIKSRKSGIDLQLNIIATRV